MPKWAVLVVDAAGESSYIRAGQDEDGPVAAFRCRDRAERMADFWREGLGDEVQSVNVVAYPAAAKEGTDAAGV